MPIYDYVCGACGHRLEVIHGVHEDGPRFCPACGAEGRMHKAISAPTIVFKGAGWAKKDRSATSASGSSKAASASDGSSGSTDKGSSEKGGSDKGSSEKGGSDKGSSEPSSGSKREASGGASNPGSAGGPAGASSTGD